MRDLFAILAVMAMTSPVVARDFVAGQVWSYHTRPGEEASLVLVDLVEAVPKLGTVYHISVLRVHLPSWKDNSRPETDLPHFPVLKETLEKSLVAYVGQRSPLESYRNGYDAWRSAFDAGKAGAFNISVAEIVSVVEESIERNRPQPSNDAPEPTRVDKPGTPAPRPSDRR
jgi:hypothetical protein